MDEKIRKKSEKPLESDDEEEYETPSEEKPKEELKIKPELGQTSKRKSEENNEIETQTSVAVDINLPDEEIVKILSKHHSHHSVSPEAAKKIPSIKKSPMEKDLLSIMSTAINNLSNELLNLKSMYNKYIVDEYAEAKEREEILKEEKDEVDRYQIDLCTVDAIDFPLSVVKDEIFNGTVKFKVPARNIKDFDVDLYEEVKESQPMFDYHLQGAQEFDRNVFNADILFNRKEDKVYPMFDTSLKGGIIPPQIGLTRRNDMTIFLEDYVQNIMTDADLLVKPPKEEYPTKTDFVYSGGPQWDTDLGKPVRLKSDLMEKLYNCHCNKGMDKKDCPCGCQNPSDDSESEAEEDCSLLTMQRAMFDYDLSGRLIKRPRKAKDSLVQPMWDFDLSSKDENNNNPESIDDEPILSRPMFDFDLSPDKSLLDPRYYIGMRGMFDVDLSQDKGEYICECGAVKDPNCVCGCQGKETVLCEEVSGNNTLMYDYNLNGDFIKKPAHLDAVALRKFKGTRGMFDVDLKFVIDPTKVKIGNCCICYEALQPDCLCGCSPADMIQTCTCVGESMPIPMWDVDLGKKLNRSLKSSELKQNGIQSINPSEPFQDEKSLEDEEEDVEMCQDKIFNMRPCICDVTKATSVPNLKFCSEKLIRSTRDNKDIIEKNYEPCERKIINNNKNQYNKILENFQVTLTDNVSEQLPMYIDLPWEDISFEPVPKPKKEKKRRFRPPKPVVKPVEEIACPTKPCPETGCIDCKMVVPIECEATNSPKPECPKKCESVCNDCKGVGSVECEAVSPPEKEFPETCENVFRPDEVTVMYQSKCVNETVNCMSSTSQLPGCECPSIMASSKIINQTSSDAIVNTRVTVSDMSTRPWSKIVSNETVFKTCDDNNILKTKIMYKISKPKIIEASSKEKIIKTKIHIIPQGKSKSVIMSTHATAFQTDAPVRENIVTNALASYENEIRPLREALTSLQQKIKTLNLPELTSSMSCWPPEPTLSTHFIINDPQNYNSLQPNHTSNFFDIVKETELNIKQTSRQADHFGEVSDRFEGQSKIEHYTKMGTNTYISSLSFPSPKRKPSVPTKLEPCNCVSCEPCTDPDILGEK